jgi:ATP-dependent helicase/DNAse subunit B
LIAPQNLTLQAERMLFEGGGAFDAEVLGFERLFYKLCGGGEFLPRHGAVMLLKKVIKENRGSLKSFSRSADFSGFAEKLYDAFKVMAAEGIAPEDLEQNAAGGEAESLKYGDIRLLYSEYLKATRGGFVDAVARTGLLTEAAKSGDFSDTSFYFAGHFALTKGEEQIAELLSATAARVAVFDCAAQDYRFGDVEFYRAAGSAEQLKAAAVRMKDARRRGVEFDEMCVISPNQLVGQARRILAEFSIPYYIDKKAALSSLPLARALELLYACAREGHKAADFIALSKNAFSGVAKPDSDAFENYCKKYRVGYLGSFLPFNAGSDAERDAPERARARLCELVSLFKTGLENAVNAEKFAAFIASLTECLDADGISATFSAEHMRSAPQKIADTARLLRRVYGGAGTKPDELAEVFFEGLKSGSVSTLPKYGGVVEVGDPSVFKARRRKYVFVIDFCEGVLPCPPPDVPFFSGAGPRLGALLSAAECGAEQARSEFLSALSLADKVFLGFTEQGEKHISGLSAYIAKNAANAFDNSQTAENDFLYDADAYKTRGADYKKRIARAVSARSAALETLIQSESAARGGAAPLPFATELEAALAPDSPEPYLNYNNRQSGFIGNAARLYFNGGGAGISKIQEYFLCPFRCFLSSGLRLREREDGRLSPPDVGAILHEAIELFVKGGDYADPDGAMEPIIDFVAAKSEKWRTGADSVLKERLKTEAKRIAGVVAHQMRGGAFRLLGAELRLGGENSALKPLYIYADGDRKIELVGSVDRVDVYKNFARVVDYKTGAVKAGFDFAGLYYGVKMQTAAYMKALQINGYEPAGMFYFPFTVAFSDDEFSHRLAGVYNSDPEILTAFDFELKAPEAKSRIIPARRKKAHDSPLRPDSFYKSNYAFATDELKMLADYAAVAAKGAVSEMLGGIVAASPADDACSYCPYTAVCGNVECGRAHANIKADYVFKALKACAKGDNADE